MRASAEGRFMWRGREPWLPTLWKQLTTTRSEVAKTEQSESTPISRPIISPFDIQHNQHVWQAVIWLVSGPTETGRKEIRWRRRRSKKLTVAAEALHIMGHMGSYLHLTHWEGLIGKFKDIMSLRITRSCLGLNWWFVMQQIECLPFREDNEGEDREGVLVNCFIGRWIWCLTRILFCSWGIRVVEIN